MMGKLKVGLSKLEMVVIDTHLIPYIMQELPNYVIRLAIADVFPEDLSEELDQKVLFNNFFIPWVLFNWIPCEDFGLSHFDPGLTIAQNYMEIYRAKLNNGERRFIEEMGESYYSFYTISEIEIEKSLLVNDILLDTTHIIKKQQLTCNVNQGDIVFSRIMALEGKSLFIGRAPFIVSKRYRTSIIDFKNFLISEHNNNSLTPYALRNVFDMPLVSYFLDVMTESVMV